MQQSSRTYHPDVPQTASRLKAPTFRFLSPLMTAIAGSLLLNELFTRTQAFAGGALSFFHCSANSLDIIEAQFSVLLVSL